PDSHPDTSTPQLLRSRRPSQCVGRVRKMAASTAPFRIKSSTLLSFALSQFLFDFHHEGIVELVKQNCGCGEKTSGRGDEAHHEANPGLHLVGLDYVGV